MRMEPGASRLLYHVAEYGILSLTTPTPNSFFVSELFLETRSGQGPSSIVCPAVFVPGGTTIQDIVQVLTFQTLMRVESKPTAHRITLIRPQCL